MAKKVGLAVLEGAVKGGAGDVRTVHQVAKVLGGLGVIRYTAPAERSAVIRIETLAAQNMRVRASAIEIAATKNVQALQKEIADIQKDSVAAANDLRETANTANVRVAVLAGYDLS